MSKLTQTAHFKYVQFLKCRLYLNKAVRKKPQKDFPQKSGKQEEMVNKETGKCVGESKKIVVTHSNNDTYYKMDGKHLIF